MWRKLLPALLLFLLLRIAAGVDLQEFSGCRLLDRPWADGDSFLVAFPDGSEHSIRLYGADTLELHINDTTAARRLRAQRRYFGISNYGGEPVDSIRLAKDLGEAARERVIELLAEPFTVHTSFADGRGSPQHKRFYGFVTTAKGEDLATRLVGDGLARAFGVYRSTPDGRHRDEYMESLRDAEFVAARRGSGIWAYTDWEMLPEERRAQRREEEEEALSMGQRLLYGPVSINQASIDELAALPRIGPVIAQRIVDNRPYASLDELKRVKGIGPATFAQLSGQIEL